MIWKLVMVWKLYDNVICHHDNDVMAMAVQKHYIRHTVTFVVTETILYVQDNDASQIFPKLM